MRPVLALARFFMQGFFKQKATTVMVLITAIIVVLSWTISDVDIGSSHKLFEDVLLTSQLFLIHFMAIFYAYEYGQKERLGGIFVLPLSMGLSRSHYIFGVILGQWLMLLFFTVILLLIDSGALWLFEGSISFVVLWQVILNLFSAMLVVLLVLLFSQFVSVMNSVIYTLTLFFLGNGLDELYIYSHDIKPNEFMQTMYSVLEYIIPNFSLFDKLGAIVNRADEDASVLYLQPVMYTIIASTLFISIMVWKFSKRALKVGE